MLSTLALVARDIKLAHSVFALPFAVLASFMAAAGVAASGGPGPIDWQRFAGQLGLVVLAMVLARTAAMLANRLIDRRLDANNPRTAGRAIPSGRLAPRRALAVLLVSAAGFLAVCAAFGAIFDNWWPATLGAPVLAWISAYPLCKRFTVLCHAYLGASLALSPLAAALAVRPEALGQQPALWLLGAMVLCWVAGFDIIYALQDETVDREQGLHSLPGRFGSRRALWVSRGLHGLAAAAVLALAAVDGRFGLLFGLGAAITVALLAWEHATVARWGTTRLALAFFTLNGLISCVLGGLGVADVLI